VILSFLRRYEFWILLAAGLVWLYAGADGGLLAFLLAAVPGGLMLTAAIGTLNLPGSRGINRVGGLGSLIGLLLAVPMLLFDPVAALGLGLLAAAALVATGLLSLDEFPLPDGLPPVERSVRTGAEVGFDEAVLGLASILMAPYADGGQARVARETRSALELFEARGWLADPHAYHRRPPPLTVDEVRLKGRHAVGWAFEEISFDSGYEPWPEVPGRDRYLSYGACRRACAWLLRGNPAAPWLICIHGLGMGRPPLDLNLLHARLLHRELGLNLVFPVLPLHGPRRTGAVSGRGFQTGDFLDTLHAESQAVWDIRRLKGWIRSQTGTDIGVHGISMGGFHTALLAALEDDLACAIAGIPVADQAALIWHHVAPAALNALRAEGVDIEVARSLLQVVSPLRLDALVPRDRRFIYAAVADRFVPARDVLLLHERWERPEILWYPGAHLSFPRHEAVTDFIANAVRSTLLAPAAGAPG
jgi:dienelactone hydrolase